MADDDDKGGKLGLFGRIFGRGRAAEPPAPAPAPPPSISTPAPDVSVSEAPPPSVIETPAASVAERWPLRPLHRLLPAPVLRLASRPPPALEPEQKRSWWQRLKSGLSRSSSAIGQSITDVFTKRKLDEAALEELEDPLLRADLGMPAATRVIDRLSRGRFNREIEPAEIRTALAGEVEASLTKVARPLEIDIARQSRS